MPFKVVPTCLRVAELVTRAGPSVSALATVHFLLTASERSNRRLSSSRLRKYRRASCLSRDNAYKDFVFAVAGVLVIEPVYGACRYMLIKPRACRTRWFRNSWRIKIVNWFSCHFLTNNYVMEFKIQFHLADILSGTWRHAVWAAYLKWRSPH